MLNFLVAVLADFFGEAQFNMVAADYKQKVGLMLQLLNIFEMAPKSWRAKNIKTDYNYLFNITPIESEDSNQIWEGRIRRSENIAKKMTK